MRAAAAIRLLRAGNSVTAIALWLGRKQPASTNIYLHADIRRKQKAIERVIPLNGETDRYRLSDSLNRVLGSAPIMPTISEGSPPLNTMLSKAST